MGNIIFRFCTLMGLFFLTMISWGWDNSKVLESLKEHSYYVSHEFPKEVLNMDDNEREKILELIDKKSYPYNTSPSNDHHYGSKKLTFYILTNLDGESGNSIFPNHQSCDNKYLEESEKEVISRLAGAIHKISRFNITFLHLEFYIEHNEEGKRALPWHQDFWKNSLLNPQILVFWVLDRKILTGNQEVGNVLLLLGKSPKNMLDYFYGKYEDRRRTIYPGCIDGCFFNSSEVQIKKVAIIKDKMGVGYIIDQRPTLDNKIIIHTRTAQGDCSDHRIKMVGRLQKLHIGVDEDCATTKLLNHLLNKEELESDCHKDETLESKKLRSWCKVHNFNGFSSFMHMLANAFCICKRHLSERDDCHELIEN